MAFIADQRYEATVKSARISYSKNGNSGIEITFDTPEGQTVHTLWLTPPNYENVCRSLDALGIEDPTHFHAIKDIPLLTGARCTLVMGEEQYMGKIKIRVKWINSLRPEASADVLAKALAFFGHGANGGEEPEDPECPF
jgi:hypothetical protein